MSSNTPIYFLVKCPEETLNFNPLFVFLLYLELLLYCFTCRRWRNRLCLWCRKSWVVSLSLVHLFLEICPTLITSTVTDVNLPNVVIVQYNITDNRQKEPLINSINISDWSWIGTIGLIGNFSIQIIWKIGNSKNQLFWKKNWYGKLCIFQKSIVNKCMKLHFLSSNYWLTVRKR